ncbi:MAG: hypothetical protein A2V98_17925 [Planctomycetes bacterium RBG_16_64_12]|nr:MAG: hypothetical protein A2V98_17925 [Planctomycetes bacterium RBG_16_64_12]
MTTCIVIGVLVVLVLFGLELIWNRRRTGRLFCVPIPRPYRNRDSQEGIWQERYGHDKSADIDAVLTSFCEAFSFNSDDRYKFGPDDQVMDIYRALYPRWKFWQLADSMEIESLTMDLRKQYGFCVEEWRPDTSLADLVELAGKKRNRP